MDHSKNETLSLLDFDGTIYKGDCSIDFYIYCLKQNPLLIILIPYQGLFVILYLVKLVSVETMK